MINNILYVLGIIAFIWVVYDVIANQKKMSGGMKAVWIILGFFFNIITAVIYYFVVKK